MMDIINEPRFVVTYWLGLIIRAKQVTVGKNPENGKWWVEVIPADAKDETDKFICGVHEVQSIEFEKGM
jgi:hypothetical protein